MAELYICSLPDNVASGFANVLDICGAGYSFVLYCGEQSVNETNYMLICKQKLFTKTSEEHMSKIILHEELPKGCGAFSLLMIEPIYHLASCSFMIYSTAMGRHAL